MTDWNRDLIQYRIERAYETLEDAQILQESRRWKACVNRLYYACYYAVSGLLLQKNLFSSKHTGIRSLFNLHYLTVIILFVDIKNTESPRVPHRGFLSHRGQMQI